MVLVEGGIVIDIVMDGPAKNALGSKMMDFLEAELDAAGGEPVRLTGAGDAFCAGLDLKEVASLDAGAMQGFLEKLERVCAKLFDYPGPTVAWVNGHAIAGGAILALCCDVRVASNVAKARIGLNEVAIGLRFPPGILRIVRARLAPAQAAEAILGAALHDPQNARRVGLVDEVVALVEADAHTRHRLEALAAHPSAAYAASKQDLGRGVTSVPDAERKRFLDEVLPTWTDEGTRTRILSVLRK